MQYSGSTEFDSDRLDSWKEIAAFFRREVRTVQLWEKAEALPVHRHVHKRRGTVHALRSELEAWRLSRQSSGAEAATRITLAVVPFEDLTPRSGRSNFCLGLVQDIITHLGRLQPERISVLARIAAPPQTLSERGLERFLRKSGVDYLLVGSIRQKRDHARVCAQLIRSSDSSYFWADSFDERSVDMIATPSTIASRITRALIRVLVLRSNFPAGAAASAFDSYLRGRYYWNKRTAEDLKKSLSYFEQAIRANPSCALAYVGLADSYNLLGFYGELTPEEAGSHAKSAASRALQLDENLAEAHVSLAEARFGFDWDWAGAEQGFKRAIELDPAYPTAHHWYGNFLSVLGRNKEAILELQCANQLDPLSLVINVWLGVVLQFASKYDEAIRQHRRTLELDPNFALAHAYLALAFEQQRAFSDSLTEFHKALALSPKHIGIKGMLGHAYAAGGLRDRAQQILRQLQALPDRTHSVASDVALIYLGLGERQNALAWLQRAYEERCPSLVYLKTDPRFGGLRSEPILQRIVRRMTPHVH